MQDMGILKVILGETLKICILPSASLSTPICQGRTVNLLEGNMGGNAAKNRSKTSGDFTGCTEDA